MPVPRSNTVIPPSETPARKLYFRSVSALRASVARLAGILSARARWRDCLLWAVCLSRYCAIPR